MSAPACFASLSRNFQLGKKKRCTAGQLTLAWLVAKWDDTIPISATKNIKYLEESLRSVGREIDRTGQCTDLKGDQRYKSQWV